MDKFSYIVILFASLIIISITILIFKRVAKDYREKGKLTVFSTTLETLIFFIHAALFSYIYLDSDFEKVEVENPITIIAIIFLVIGFVLTTVSMSGLGFKKSIGQEVNTVKRSGFYKYSRNPQIVFYGFLIIGYALFWPSLSGLIWILLYFFIAHIMVKTEETHLQKIHGKDYKDYCACTPRYVGLPKRNILC